MSLSVESLVVEADRCVACGLCLPHCPTYRKTGSEADSPRGRIQLMRAVSQNILPNNARFKEHIDLCLSCRSCESACPNSVNYGALVDTSRALHIQKKSIWFSVAKPFIRHRSLQVILGWSLWWVQQLGLGKLLSALIPAAKKLPTVTLPILWKPLYPAANKLGDVSLFIGCASNTFDNQTIKSAIYVLNQLGFDVHLPEKQTCCGSIARQLGDAIEAQKLVNQNQSSFQKEIPIISIASGCGAGLKDYLPQHKVSDISAFLVSCDWSNSNIKSLKEQIYVQDPCSLRNVQKSHQAAHQLLKKIPEAEILALPENTQCCGGAGSYMLTQSTMANQLRDDKLTAIKAKKVAILSTSNIGCSLHIAAGLRENHLPVKVLHPVQIIAQQMGFAGVI